MDKRRTREGEKGKMIERKECCIYILRVCASYRSRRKAYLPPTESHECTLYAFIKPLSLPCRLQIGGIPAIELIPLSRRSRLSSKERGFCFPLYYRYQLGNSDPRLFHILFRVRLTILISSTSNRII